MSAVAQMERIPSPVEANMPKGVAVTPMEMLSQALERGAAVEVLERLVMLSERWEANQARKSFDAAMAAAKAAMPAIAKNRHVKYDKVDYRHEDLGEIAKVIGSVLAEHGLSYRFRTTSTDAGNVTVTCIISHRDGHSEETALSAAHDKSGGKNAIQAIGSAVTYLQRYTLKSALGLAAAADDDGAASAGGAPKETITAQQAKQLRDALAFRDVSEERALRRFKVEQLEDIYADKFEDCLRIAQNAGGAK